MGGYQRRVHGDSLLVTSRRSTKMMKTIAIVLLAAVAIAEPDAKPKADADPYLLYGGYYGHGLGYYGHGLGYGYGYYGKRDADAYLYRGYYGLGGYRGYGGYYGHRYYGKRSADAEPKADPYLLYGGYGHLGYAGHYGYPYAAYSYYG